MTKEYQSRHSVAKLDKTPPKGSFRDRYLDLSPWMTASNMLTFNLVNETTNPFVGGGNMRIRINSGNSTNWGTMWRALPYSFATYMNYNFAIGHSDYTNNTDMSFVFGQVDNNNVAKVMKFKITAWGSTPCGIQYWNATTNAWVTMGTLNLGTITKKKWIVIVGKMNLQTGYMVSLQIGSQIFDLSAVPLETEIGQVFNSGLATPRSNIGLVGVEYTNGLVASIFDFYLDIIRVWASTT